MATSPWAASPTGNLEDRVMLKTFGTRTQGYVRRGKRGIYIGTFDDARVAEAAAFHAAMRMPEDLEEEEDAHKEKILPPRPSTKSHGVVLWTTRKYESGKKELGNYKVSHYEGYISKVSREPHGLGTMSYFDGRVYHGEWFEGLKYGHGKEISSDGEVVYEGRYKANRRHGAGFHSQNDDEQFTTGGFWKNGKYFRGFSKKEVEKIKGKKG